MRTFPPTRLRAVVVPITLLTLIACGGQPAAPAPTALAVASPQAGIPGPSPSTDPMPAATPTNEPEPSSGPVADPEPSSIPSPSSAPTPIAATGTWTVAPIPLAGSCWDVGASVDEVGRMHVAASCDGVIRYASSIDGRAWKTAHFALPAHRSDVTPQLVIDGSTLYLAYTRLRVTDGGCGDDGLDDVGVFYRTRHLPDGTWSAPTRIGRPLDHLQGFRVAAGVIHETFTTNDGIGPISYGRLDRGRYRSTVIPGATGTSLRVGSDGRARIAYTTGSAIRYAVADRDASLSIRTIFRSTNMQLGTPSMVLGPGNRAAMAWAAHEIHQSGGCAEPEPPTPQKPGIYFASDAGGSWSVRWISRIIEDPAIALDVRTGRVDVVVSYPAGIRQLTRDAKGTWSGRRIPGSSNIGALLLRGIPRTGGLLLIGLREQDVSDSSDDPQPPALVALVQS